VKKPILNSESQQRLEKLSGSRRTGRTGLQEQGTEILEQLQTSLDLQYGYEKAIAQSIRTYEMPLKTAAQARSYPPREANKQYMDTLKKNNQELNACWKKPRLTAMPTSMPVTAHRQTLNRRRQQINEWMRRSMDDQI
jgi:hypothetical protein